MGEPLFASTLSTPRAGGPLPSAGAVPPTDPFAAHPPDGQPEPSSFTMIDRGEALSREALFGAAALARGPEAMDLLRRLDAFLREPARFGSASPADLVQARLLKAFVIMQIDAGQAIQRQERYEAAEKIVRSVIETTAFHEDAPELLLPANALDLELAVRRYERAAHQGDVKARRKLLPKILERATVLLANQADEPAEKREIAALYEAEVIGFLARMQLWNVAVDRARRFTTNPAYAETAGARAVLDSPLLAPFVDEGRVLSSAEIRRRAPLFKAALAKIRAAFAEARAADLTESAIAGAIGATGTLGVLGALTMAEVEGMPESRIVTALIPATVAAGFSVFNRLRNGWASDEALSAGMTGIFERTPKESAKDVARLLLQGGLETAVWLAPSSVVPVIPEAGTIIGTTLWNAGVLYYSFFPWAWGKICLLGHADTYVRMADSLSSLSEPSLKNALNFFEKTLMVMAGGQYLGFLFLKQYREFFKKWAWLSIPGSVMLGAQLGLAITGEGPEGWNDRIMRSSIALVEGLLMLMTGGVIPFDKRGSVFDVVRSMGSRVRTADHNALVAIALTVGVSSALGGQLQRDKTITDVALLAAQGAAITVGLLPITILISGVMKRNIELPEGVTEAWVDAAGEPLKRRLFEATMGGLDSFWTPYMFNRVGRSPTLDIPSATVRSQHGWDTSEGYGIFVLINAYFTNPAATMTFSETGGVDWERAAFLDVLRGTQKGTDQKLPPEKRIALIKDHWVKAALRIPLTHWLRPHNLSDALFPLAGVARIVKPPLFPFMPQPHYFSSMQQFLAGGYERKLKDDDLEILLAAVDSFAGDALAEGMAVEGGGAPRASSDAGRLEALSRRLMEQDLLRALLLTLEVTRNDAVHGHRIAAFLDERAWLFDALGIDRQTIPEIEGTSRRRRRAEVRKVVEMPMERYDEHVREHAARMKPSALEGAFTAPRFTGVVDAPPSGTPAEAGGDDEGQAPSVAEAVDGSGGAAATPSAAAPVAPPPPPTVLP